MGLSKLAIVILLFIGIFCSVDQNQQIYEYESVQSVYNKIGLNQRPKTDQTYFYNEQDSDLSPQDLQSSNYISHYSRQHFRPTESFSFFLKGNQSYQFVLFPNMSDIFIGGKFNYSYQFKEGQYYCQECVNLLIFQEDFIIRQYGRKQATNRFFFSHKDKDHKYRFSFKNEGNQTRRINITYQYSSIYSTSSAKKLLNISRVTSMFEKINKVFKLQQSQTRNLIKIAQIQLLELQNHSSESIWQLIFETLLISLGNFISLYALKKHLYNDYDLLH